MMCAKNAIIGSTLMRKGVARLLIVFAGNGMLTLAIVLHATMDIILQMITNVSVTPIGIHIAVILRMKCVLNAITGITSTMRANVLK